MTTSHQLRSGRRWWRAALVGAVALASLTGAATAVDARPQAAAAPAGPSSLVGDFVSQINGLRGTLGLRSLAVSDQLTRKATSWSQHMASTANLAHSPNLGGDIAGWTLIGENVGVGFDVLGLMGAFIRSAAHYDNLADARYTHVGVGVAHGADGMLYTTHLFMAAASAPAPAPTPPPAPAPDPEPAPAPTPRAERAAATSAPTTTTTAPAAPPPPPPPPVPNGTPDRVGLVLGALRTLELT